jgi:cardiolipin synthase
MVSAMHLAERELIVTTPYFVPDATLMTALVTAAARGVETTLIVPARNDAPIVDRAGKASYARLLDAGVRILRYTPGCCTPRP